MNIIRHPDDAVVYEPTLPREYEPRRPRLELPGGAKLAVSLLLHAPSYQDDLPATAIKPMAMSGGVGRETSEPRHGQVARLSQWDFGLTVGIFRLTNMASRLGLPFAVALDAAGASTMPGLAAGIAAIADEIVVRGRAANDILGESMTAEEERSYIRESRSEVESATGRSASGWFSPERASSTRTTGLLAAEGFEWFGDWPHDERPVELTGAAAGLVAVPTALETEDMFALFARGLPYQDYERLLTETLDQLIEDAAVDGGRTVVLGWFGWVLGQACFADVAERIMERLANDPDIIVVTPHEMSRIR
jgi:hypothetical protein